jgi:hypothetical protein
MMCGCGRGGGGGSAGVLDQAAVRQALTLNVQPESFLGRERQGEFTLKTEEHGGEVVAEVHVDGARSLKALYCNVRYDALALSPVEATAGDALGAASDLLTLSVAKVPGVVHFGEVLIRPQDKAGLSGSGTLAVMRFARGGGRSRVASDGPTTNNAPTSDTSRGRCIYDPLTHDLNWWYSNQGDYDQNTVVTLADLTPLAVRFSERGPFEYFNAISVVNGDGNAEINLGDITPIAANFGRNVGQTVAYALYGSMDPGDYPAANDEAQKISPFANVGWVTVLGWLGHDRLFFVYNIPAPQANMFYWARPLDANGYVGTPTDMVLGDPTMVPSISLTNPPAVGNGTLGNPYVLDLMVEYQFYVGSGALGDRTTDLDTEYYLSDTSAGTLTNADGILRLNPAFWGELLVWASWNHATANGPIYAQVPPPFSFNQQTVDAGGGTNDVGSFASLANIDNKPCIAYYDATDKNLKYATLTAPWTWDVQVVDSLDDVGGNCSMVELNGGPAIVYEDQSVQSVRFAWGNGPDPLSWTIHNALYGTQLGSRTSIWVIGGKAAFVFGDENTGALVYARATVAQPADSVDWQVHAVDGTAGANCEPCLRSVNGLPGVVYRDVANGYLHYARATTAEPLTNTDWVSMVVDYGSPGDTGHSPSLYSFEGLLPVVSYCDHGQWNLMYAYAAVDPSATSDWHITKVVTDGEPGMDSSLNAINGRMCIAYLDLISNSLHLARATKPYPDYPGDWAHEDVDNGPDVGGWCSLAPVGDILNAQAGVAYWDYGHSTLVFALGS